MFFYFYFQETRVCERVDEVDCTKSEKFYSLNLELYGSTLAPPTPEPQKSLATEQSQQQTKPSHEPHTDPTVDDVPTTSYNKPQIHLTEVPDSTEDPVQEIKKEEPRKPQPSTIPPIQVPEEDLTEGNLAFELTKILPCSAILISLYTYYLVVISELTVANTNKFGKVRVNNLTRKMVGKKIMLLRGNVIGF